MLESHIGRLGFVHTLSSTCMLGPRLEFGASILKFPGYVSWFRADSGTNRICAFIYNVRHFYCLYRDIVECSLFRYLAVQVRFSSRAVGIFLHPVTKSKKLFLSISQYIFVDGLWLVILVGHPEPEKKNLLAFLSTFWHPCSKCLLMCFKKDRGGCQV